MRSLPQITRKSYKVLKGPEFKEKRVRKVADLNKSMLGSKGDVCIHSNTVPICKHELTNEHYSTLLSFPCRWRRERIGAT